MKKILLVLLVSSAFNGNLFSQCCSQGAPMAGDANVGVLKKGSVRISSFYKYSFSENRNVEVNQAVQENANFNFVGLSLGYGITSKMTAELELGYFLNKTLNFETRNTSNRTDFVPQKFVVNGFGITNGVVSIKHVLIKKEGKGFELTGGLGFKFPFQSELQIVDGVELPIDNLPSTYAPGIVPKFLIFKKSEKLKMAFVLLQRVDYNFENIKGYRYGTSSVTTLIASKNLAFISDKLTGLLQFRNEYRAMDIKTNVTTGAKEPIATSGNHIVVVAPQLSLRLFNKVNTSIAVDLPVYKNYRVDKLENIYAATFNCSIDL